MTEKRRKELLQSSPLGRAVLFYGVPGMKWGEHIAEGGGAEHLSNMANSHLVNAASNRGLMKHDYALSARAHENAAKAMTAIGDEHRAKMHSDMAKKHKLMASGQIPMEAPKVDWNKLDEEMAMI